MNNHIADMDTFEKNSEIYKKKYIESKNIFNSLKNELCEYLRSIEVNDHKEKLLRRMMKLKYDDYLLNKMLYTKSQNIYMYSIYVRDKNIYDDEVKRNIQKNKLNISSKYHVQGGISPSKIPRNEKKNDDINFEKYSADDDSVDYDSADDESRDSENAEDDLTKYKKKNKLYINSGVMSRMENDLKMHNIKNKRILKPYE